MFPSVVGLTGNPNPGRVNKASFGAKGFPPPFFNAEIHSGAIKQNAGDTFISKFSQLRLTQWGSYWVGPFQSLCIKERPLSLWKIQAYKLARFNIRNQNYYLSFQ